MAESDTLLAYLVSSFPGNTENIATEALKHVMERSGAAMEALNDVIQSGVRDILPVNLVRSQSVGSDGTIPDLVGIDEGDQERALIEVKFWAELTNNQPNGYLNRLPDDGPTVLVFLVPEVRVQTLWPELEGRVSRAGHSLSLVESERRCARIDNSQKHMMIVSWTGLLDAMAARVSDTGEATSIESAIRQLRTLTKHADSSAFKPIQKGQELGADSERRERDYRRVIDDATEQGISEGWLSKKGLNRTPRPYGYGRYIRLSDTIVWFGVNKSRFEMTSESPLWIELYPRQDKADHIRLALGLSESWIPVPLENDVEYPAVLDGVVSNLKQISDSIEEAKTNP